MKNYGIIPAYQIPTNKDLLFFDAFISIGGGRGKQSGRQNPSRYGMDYFSNSDLDAMEAAYAYLCEQKLIREETPSLDVLLGEASNSGLPIKDIEDSRKLLESAIERQPHFGHSWIPPVGSGLPLYFYTRAKENLYEYESHVRALLFSLLKSGVENVYTPIAQHEGCNTIFNGQKHPVISVAINALPVPIAEIPYEEILTFKQERQVNDQLQLMRRWIRKQIATEDVKAAELAEELADSLHDYTECMRLARMKYRTEVLQVLVSFPLATVERILTLKFSEIFDPIFSIRKAHLALCEAELNAPGRELAYLHSVTNRFGTLDCDPRVT